jgi:hypothetical protein
MKDQKEIKMKCNLCGEEFTEIAELELHQDENHEGEPLDFKLLEEKEQENLAIEESEDEPLDEGVSEEEARGATILEHYGEIDDQTLRKMVLSRALGQSVGSDKKFPEQIKLSDVPQEYLRQFKEKIESGYCPVSGCGLHCSQLGNGLSGEAEEEFKEQLILSHIEKEHPKVYEMLKDLFPVPEKTEVDVQHVEVSNPESCSREELAKAIFSDPQLTREFYLRAFKKLQGKD